MKAEVQQVVQQREDAQKELERLQDICGHMWYRIQLYSWRPGVADPVKICEECLKHLGPPTTKKDIKLGEKLMRPLTTHSGYTTFTISVPGDDL